MPTAKITKRFIDSLKPRQSDFYVFDTELTGFGVRVRQSGAMSYIIQYKAGRGRGAATRRVTLGAVGKLTPETARNEAKQIIGDVISGNDPAKRARDARNAATISELTDAFMVEHVEAKRKPNTVALYRHIFRNEIIPKLGAVKAASLSKSEASKLHSKMRDRPYLANRTLAVLGSMYVWAGKRGLTPEGLNPTVGIEKFCEKRRERFLSTDELDRLGAAIRKAETDGIPWKPSPEKKSKHAPRAENRCVRISPQIGAAIRLLILTGARLREILHLQWSEVDMERGLLFLPDSKTGRKTIVLNAPALAVLSALPRETELVIPGDKPGKPRSDLKRPWALIAKESGLEGVRLHDLRHTHASFGIGASIGLPIIGKLLGHTQMRTTERYAHLDNDPLRKASETIGASISTAMGEEASQSDRNRNVVNLKK